MFYLATWDVFNSIHFEFVVILNIAHLDLSGPGSSWPCFLPVSKLFSLLFLHFVVVVKEE